MWEIARRLRNSNAADAPARPAFESAKNLDGTLDEGHDHWPEHRDSEDVEAGRRARDRMAGEDAPSEESMQEACDAESDGAGEEEGLGPYTASAMVEPDPSRAVESGWWEESVREDREAAA